MGCVSTRDSKFCPCTNAITSCLQRGPIAAMITTDDDIAVLDVMLNSHTQHGTCLKVPEVDTEDCDAGLRQRVGLKKPCRALSIASLLVHFADKAPMKRTSSASFAFTTSMSALSRVSLQAHSSQGLSRQMRARAYTLRRSQPLVRQRAGLNPRIRKGIDARY